MIQLSKNYSLPERSEEFIPIKIVSVGGAGLNALDRIVLDGLEGAEVLAVNTDVQSLASSVAAHKVQLGRTVTRGLGAGGDPELGYQAAFESTEEIREALTGARMIFICTGLGGGAICCSSRSRRGRAGACVRHAAVCVRRQASQRPGARSSGPS